MNLKIVACLVVLSLVGLGAALTYGLTIISYAPSNDYQVIVDPSPSPTPTATPPPVQVSGTTILTGTAASIVHGASITLTAQITPPAVTVVTFSKDGVAIGTATSDALGTATLTITDLTPGTYKFKAQPAAVTQP